MSEFKGTPGPWEVLNETDVFTALGADSGDGVKANSSDGWMIADCCGCVTFSEMGAVELGLDLRRANAKLIAAAPDLLEALQELRDLMQGVIDGEYEPDFATLQITDAAIAKATA